MLTRPDGIEQGASITTSHADKRPCTRVLHMQADFKEEDTPACERLLEATHARNTATASLHPRAGFCRGRSTRRKVSLQGCRVLLQPRTEDPETGKIPSLDVQSSARVPAGLLWLLATASITQPRRLNSCFRSTSLLQPKRWVGGGGVGPFHVSRASGSH